MPASTLAYATRLFLAATLALTFARWLGLSNIYWAAMPVWVVIQPNREDMALRAVLRVAGTLVGAGIGIAALHWLPVPGIALTVALTAAIGVGIAYRIGTHWAYGFTLMAITIGVVVMPALGMGAEAIPLALDRVYCTLIGVASVTAVNWLFTPARAVPMAPRPNPHFAQQLWIRMAAVATLTGAATLLDAHFSHPAATAAGLSVVVFSAVLGSMPNPRPAVRFLVPGVALGVLAAVSYRTLAPLTGGDPAALLILAFAFIAGGALLRAHPRTSLMGIDINMCFLLAGEIGAPGHSLPVTAAGAATMFLTSAAIAALMFFLSRLHPPLETA
ncbi:MAG: FUSC family protein [Thioclava marina]|uniref:FUSC family protein n=1 Tax=Thioclava marina TaxID=1915077 RepID=UPI0019ABAB23|nr:FUSC family protein [Thioclava marina]MBC7146978.1 FUSC family protein [Thioclava marina]